MSIKKSVMLADHFIAYAKARGLTRGEDGDVLWSQAVNGAVSSLTRLYDLLLPDLTEQDWHLILNAFNGHFFTDMDLHVSIASCIMDDLGVLELSEVDPKVAESVRKIAKLTVPEQAAVLDMARKFWGASERSGNSLLEIIQGLRGI
ncbi:hypothetical protein QU487_06455 [Crenobacter sp. SG2305]|uniref:hypothetical protein n=1 Tax=Crenobacter oryzisoli TaxID=3056844 RepID=UPI0025AB108C|nr:hypothetical protein [Crenobacter sp. SG2305]MDN0082394.1 hypothetical protein [Crenobacter sp. SG2305]